MWRHPSWTKKKITSFSYKKTSNCYQKYVACFRDKHPSRHALLYLRARPVCSRALILSRRFILRITIKALIKAYSQQPALFRMNAITEIKTVLSAVKTTGDSKQEKLCPQSHPLYSPKTPRCHQSLRLGPNGESFWERNSCTRRTPAALFPKCAPQCVIDGTLQFQRAYRFDKPFKKGEKKDTPTQYCSHHRNKPIYYGGFMHVSCICLNRKYWQQLHHRLNDIETANK